MPSLHRPLAALFITTTTASAATDFARDVFPVLQRACFECHGAEKQKGKLRLDSRDAALRGGDSGAALVPGKADASEMLRRVLLPKGDDEVMPNRGELLSKNEIGHLREWIASGAPWAEDMKPAKHWVYVAPVRPAVPGGGNAIDAFVRERLKKEGLAPSPPADPHVIARRMYFDITGLPPTPDEVDAFAKSAVRNPQSAIESLADKLLASPQYGEKWARPWLDAARYADSHGFQRDDLRPLRVGKEPPK